MGNAVSHSYLHFIGFFLCAFFLSAATLKLVFIINKKLYSGRQDRSQDDSYAGGFQVLSNARRDFPVRFFLVALLFVVFNAEVLLLMPWAASLRLSGLEGFFCAVFFLLFWGIAYFYAYKKGALEWK